MTWPAALQSLTFEGDVNQSLDNVTWPASLQTLTFRENFNQALVEMETKSQILKSCWPWPASLQTLTFRENFNQSLDKPGQGDMASRPSKLDFWVLFQSELEKSVMARRPSKFDSWFPFQPEP